MQKQKMAERLMKPLVLIGLIITSIFMISCSKVENKTTQSKNDSVDIKYCEENIVVDNLDNVEGNTEGNMITDKEQAYEIACIILKERQPEKYSNVCIAHDKVNELWKIDFSPSKDVLGGGFNIILDGKTSKVIGIFGTE